MTFLSTLFGDSIVFILGYFYYDASLGQLRFLFLDVFMLMLVGDSIASYFCMPSCLVSFGKQDLMNHESFY